MSYLANKIDEVRSILTQLEANPRHHSASNQKAKINRMKQLLTEAVIMLDHSEPMRPPFTGCGDKFWTVTDKDTKRTNSTSKRYPSEDAAINEATARLATKPDHPGVYILTTVALVQRELPPVVVKRIGGEA